MAGCEINWPAKKESGPPSLTFDCVQFRNDVTDQRPLKRASADAVAAQLSPADTDRASRELNKEPPRSDWQMSPQDRDRVKRIAELVEKMVTAEDRLRALSKDFNLRSGVSPTQQQQAQLDQQVYEMSDAEGELIRGQYLKCLDPPNRSQKILQELNETEQFRRLGLRMAEVSDLGKFYLGRKQQRGPSPYDPWAPLADIDHCQNTRRKPTSTIRSVYLPSYVVPPLRID
jgi:hypothetical protein